MTITKIRYSTTSPFGGKVRDAVSQIREAQVNIMRVKQTADSLTNGGANPELLETAPEFMVSTGQGNAFYIAVQSLASFLFANASTWSPPPASIDLYEG